jgi:cyclohexyl-isocyanide hydratase
MNRRDFTAGLAFAGAVPWLDSLMGRARWSRPLPPGAPQSMAMIMYPGMFPLDLIGPHAVLGGHFPIHLVWKTRQPFEALGITFTPSMTFAECPEVDMLFVPGGTTGTIAAMEDEECLAFLETRAKTAQFLTSVCTGSLVLGAAGLLKGRRATSHWAVRDTILPIVGATPVAERVVVDGTLVTGAGVSAGIDFGLALAASIAGEEMAKIMQLNIEYDPDPPFDAGTPAKAGSAVTDQLRGYYTPFLKEVERAARLARRARS